MHAYARQAPPDAAATRTQLTANRLSRRRSLAILPGLLL